MNFKNALEKKRNFYLSVFTNRFTSEVKKINSYNIANIPALKKTNYEADIKYYNNILDTYSNKLDNILENKKDDDIIFTEEDYRKMSKITIDNNGKLNGKYPYYTTNVLDKGIYKIKNKEAGRIILENSETILIKPTDNTISNDLIVYSERNKLKNKIDTIRLLFLNIESRKNYLELSIKINNILDQLRTGNSDNIINLIDEFQEINNKVIDNNTLYLSNIDTITNKKNRLVKYIEKDETSLNILTKGCKIIESDKIQLYIDNNDKLYIKLNNQNKYIEDNKKYKKLHSFGKECLKAKKLREKWYILKKSGQKQVAQNKEEVLNNKINKLTKLIPDINRVSIKLQFYENEKMSKNTLKANLINQKLKIQIISYVTNYLEILENIYFITESNIRIFNEHQFIKKLENTKTAPLDFNNIKKGTTPIDIEYNDKQFIITGIVINYEDMKNFFEKKMDNLKEKLKLLFDNLEIKSSNNTFKLLDDIYCYKINYNKFKQNYKLTNYLNASTEPYLEMILHNDWFSNETLLKRNDKELIIKSTIYQIQTISNSIVKNFLIIKTDESQIFFNNDTYLPYQDISIINNTINELKTIGNTFTLNNENHIKLLAYSLDNNTSELIEFDTVIHIVDILFIFKINDSTITIENKQLLNENYNYYIVNKNILDKDPNKIYSKYQINKVLDKPFNNKIDISNDTNRSNLSINALGDAGEELFENIVD